MFSFLSCFKLDMMFIKFEGRIDFIFLSKYRLGELGVFKGWRVVLIGNFFLKKIL